ncbi:MAG TPA: N-6 DNA methylase [Fimbriimonadaceae bacterium]|nr:N-6 DNA methylase [Fimbriimonadaceae bacterium]HRJ34104.1 N-6 DNA methylase [Fimbriimonadaceae bacterium]
MAQLENIEAIERRLWSAADNLRANSNLASNEYFLPVMGLIFLRHAYSRYLAVKPEIESKLPSRGGVVRPLTKEDFSERSAIYLRPEAQFDYLVENASNAKLPEMVIAAMESIEKDYRTLEGVLPKQEYQELDYTILGDLVRKLNPDELKKADGDIFGRIYEYFLTQFADQGAHDGGEFFTPISLVGFIANVLEPEGGIVADPACGSGGMFVQSAHIVERKHENPAEKLTFRGYEKNKTTANLAKMNLAVHGLEGSISSGNDANSYYNDPQNLFKSCDYVMANPPFNVDEVDAEKVKNDPRLPFGLPGVNKGGKVSNANYLWIQYFYSYMSDRGKAGFVMSSQASSAGRDEAKVRERLIKSGHVDMMVAIRSGFFYTRTVPCELWFLNKAKPEQYKDKVLMLDARNVHRRVTRKIYDFSPEQLQNLLSIVWLYRGETGRFWKLIEEYLERSVVELEASVFPPRENPIAKFQTALNAAAELVLPFVQAQEGHEVSTALVQDFVATQTDIQREIEVLLDVTPRSRQSLDGFGRNEHSGVSDIIHHHVEGVRDLIRSMDHSAKLLGRLIEIAEKEFGAKEADAWANTKVTRARKELEELRVVGVNQLKLARYFSRQARWLLERFPNGELVDVEGLVKLVGPSELEKNDWSLTPGRYVGVAPEIDDEDFDFDEAITAIHEELAGLNEEALGLAATISRNFRELIG